MKHGFLFTVLVVFCFFVVLVSFSPFSNSGLSNDVLDHTNKFRRSQGLTNLVMREDLSAIARRHSVDMANRRVAFGHGGFSKRYAQAGKMVKPLKAFAENVAYGPKSGKEVVKMWKNSSPHRRNLLGRYKYVGIGTAKDRRGVIYYTQVFAK